MSPPSAPWELLPWDTAFFGVRTGRIARSTIDEAVLHRTLEECHATGVKVLYYLAPADDDRSVRLAEAAGFHLVDVRVTLEWPASAQSEAPSIHDEILRDHRPEDVSPLQAIARNNYHHSRYYYDQHYPRERCDELYAEWIAQSCLGKAEHVLVVERNREPVAYITCHLDLAERRGRIGLLGVRADARGLGVGGRLVRAAQRWFTEREVRRVSVVTQGRNVDALRLYQRQGFVTSCLHLWYHKWFAQ